MQYLVSRYKTDLVRYAKNKKLDNTIQPQPHTQPHTEIHTIHTLLQNTTGAHRKEVLMTSVAAVAFCPFFDDDLFL